MYNELFTRSFSKHEQKKLSIWAFVGCFVMALSFCVLLNSHMSPLPPCKFLRFNFHVDFQLTSNLRLKVFSIIDTLNDKGNGRDLSAMNTSKPAPTSPVKEVVQVNEVVVEKVQVIKKMEPLPLPICDFSLPKSDFCDINGDVRIQGNSSIFLSPFLVETSNISTWRIMPYARKHDRSVKARVRQLTLGSPSSFGLNEMPKCSVNHSVQAIVFSTGGYAGNTFHDFSDILVPLYITSRQYNRKVQFVVTDIKPWWFIKYRAYIDALSKYKIIDMDNSNDVHCFQHVVFGLKGHKEFGIDPNLTKEGYSMRSFTQFVRSAYSLKRNKVDPIELNKPRLLIISRKGSRSMVNEEEVANEARSLGYEVSIMDARKNLRDFSKIVNSFDVMIGVHGAGMTNSIFLPENAVLVQVVPLGLEWLSKHDFELPASAMKLRYLEYKISGKESSLSDKYPLEHPFIQNPTSIKGQGWFAFKEVFLDGQSVRIDVGRFRNTLLKALELLRK
ncbi:hypothetical protein V2J09_020389 [Rumex salicifolius]